MAKLSTGPAVVEPEDIAASAELRPVAAVAAEFRAAWAGARDPQTADPDLLPVRLARAAADVLGADGAGISFYEDDFRVPLGASDEMTTLAERLQFTQGQGPCLDAA